MREIPRRTLAFPLLLALAACGGGGGSPTSPSTPGPTATPAPTGVTVTGQVFYDENGNGVVDGNELVRLPGVTVSIGGRTGRTETSGRFSVANVPTGAQTATFASGGLPPYFENGTPVAVQVASSGAPEVSVPATLPIGTNRRNLYMGFGDSIAAGEGGHGGGFMEELVGDLRSYWGKADYANEGLAGTKSDAGAERLSGSLSRERPAWTIILYGTNDWNSLECKDERFPCYTIDSLRSMVGQCKAFGSMPILGTIPPVNPNFVDRQAAERNDWVKRMNALIRPMAQQERVPLADVEAVFLRQPSLSALFVDHVHPNDEGHSLIAKEYFRVMTTATSASTAGVHVFGPLHPGD